MSTKKKNSYLGKVDIFSDTSLYDVYKTTVGDFISGVLDTESTSYEPEYTEPARIPPQRRRNKAEELTNLYYELEISIDRAKEWAHKGMGENIKGNFAEAAECFFEGVHCLARGQMAALRQFSELNTPFKHRKKIDEEMNKLNFSGFKSFGELCFQHGDYTYAKNCFAEALSCYPQLHDIGKILLGRAEMYEFLKKGIETGDETLALQHFMMAINKGKEILTISKPEVKLRLKSDISLCEGLKLLLEGLLESEKVKIEEAKQKFEEASVVAPQSYLAFKMFCDYYCAILDENEQKIRTCANKLPELMNLGGQNLLTIYLDYLVTKFVHDEPESSFESFEKQLEEFNTRHHRILRQESERFKEKVYSELPLVCPNCRERTSYIEIDESTYECTKCHHLVRVNWK